MNTGYTVFLKNKKIDQYIYLLCYLVGKTGFEPATPWSQTKYSTKLSYFPVFKQSKNGALRLRFQLHPRGVEPLTA